MPEAFACLFIFVVAVASYIGAKLTAANPANRSVQAELIRLKQHRVRLEERLQQAGRENWEQAMCAQIADEIEDTEALLAKTVSELKAAA